MKKLEKHLKEQHCPEEERTCIACGDIGKLKSDLETHLLRRGKFHDGRCVRCDKEFNMWKDHKAHVNEEHQGKFHYRCGECGEKFETLIEMKTHRVEHSAREVCDLCGGLFTQGWRKNNTKEQYDELRHSCT